MFCRIRKVEEPLKKRVSWIDGGEGGDDGIRGYSSGIRVYSQNFKNGGKRGSRPASRTTAATQYEEPQADPVDETVMHDAEDQSDSGVRAIPTARGSQQRRPITHRTVKSIKPINVTFPFPVTPDRYLRTESLTASVTSHSSRRTSSSSSVVAVLPTHHHRRTGRHFTGGAEKFCPENNNLP